MLEHPLSGQRIFVAGHRGMVGSAIVRSLENEACEIVTAGRDMVDLLDQHAVEQFLKKERLDVVIVAAAKVGGILANSSYPASFLYENLTIASNLIHGSHIADINRLLFLGSSCIYPKFAEQPIVEESLLTGPLEPTNEWYAIAKIAGIKLCQAYRAQYGRDYISAMPTNLFGPGDNFDLDSSHVLPALSRKAHQAKESSADNFEIWGSGKPRREFLYSEDCADACVHLLKNYHGDIHVNVGSGKDIPIIDLARMTADIVGFQGDIVLDQTKPDGTPRKLMDATRLLEMGWQPKVGLAEGIEKTYEAYLKMLDA